MGWHAAITLCGSFMLVTTGVVGIDKRGLELLRGVRVGIAVVGA